ncbi:MAG: 50S ribosomal protein L13 [Gemmatimonadales bacterium]
MKTYSPKAGELEHKWHVVDADGVVLGRLASRVAQLIRGKHKPTFAPHMDTGDYVVVINAAKVKLTGAKLSQKEYFKHTGYMGHARFSSVSDVLAKHPERVVERAVFGMLPKGTLGKQVLRKKLKVYAGSEHPHGAQSPAELKLERA